jgi:hypothetical protein
MHRAVIVYIPYSSNDNPSDMKCLEFFVFDHTLLPSLTQSIIIEN